MTVSIDAVPSDDPRWPWKVRITTRDDDGQLLGVRNFRQLTEADAIKYADQLRTAKAWA